jgi:hypothetical protein
MFGKMTDLVENINEQRMATAQTASKLAETDATRKNLENFALELEQIRKKIVATTEGGAITGEERLREHTDFLYGAILSYEGRPAKYQIERIDVLQRQLEDIQKEFDTLMQKRGGVKPTPSAP